MIEPRRQGPRARQATRSMVGIAAWATRTPEADFRRYGRAILLAFALLAAAALSRALRASPPAHQDQVRPSRAVTKFALPSR